MQNYQNKPQRRQNVSGQDQNPFAAAQPMANQQQISAMEFDEAKETIDSKVLLVNTV